MTGADISAIFMSGWMLEARAESTVWWECAISFDGWLPDGHLSNGKIFGLRTEVA